MATNIFIRIGDIKGESSDSAHQDEIEVLSWAWGLANPTMVSSGGGAGGKASFQDLTFTHRVDKASPNIMLACASGTHFKEARLTMRQTGAPASQDFLLIGLRDVVVKCVQPSGTETAAGLMEQVSLNFARVDFEYKPQKPDGSLDAGVHFRWDLEHNSTF